MSAHLSQIRSEDRAQRAPKITKEMTVQTFKQVQFVGFNQAGKQLSKTIAQIKARDAYEAGDAIKAMFPAFAFNVTLKFGLVRKLDADSISARVARNAGPEEV